MMIKPGNEPAYPVEYKGMDGICEFERVQHVEPGITIRQEYVKAAMEGLLTAGVATQVQTDELAKIIIEIADACLKKEEDTR